MSLLTLVADPDRFFRRRRSDPRLRGPVALVAVATVAGLAAALVLVEWVVGGVTGPVREFAELTMLARTVPSALFVPAVTWFLFSVTFFALAVAQGGEGDLRSTFALVGWGFLPRVLNTVVFLALVLVTTSSLASPARGGDPAVLLDRLSMLRWAGLAFVAWSGLLWLFAVKNALGVDDRTAAVAVGVPLAVEVALRVGSLV